MSAPDSAVEPTTVPVEEVKSDAPPVAVTVEPTVEEPAAATEAVEATPATDAPAVTEEPAKDEPKPEPVSKSPTFLGKILNTLKGGEKKPKAPKSPKKEKKQEEAVTAAVEEAPKEAAKEPAAVETPVVQVSEPPKEEAAEPVVTETPAATTAVAPTEEDKPAAPQKGEPKAIKVGRRLSTRVADLFKAKPKSEVVTPAKVDEHPPKIDEPVPVAPLENPATEAAEVKAQEPVEAAAPVITATA